MRKQSPGGALLSPREIPVRVIPHGGFPLWGKLSPQVTDEGALAGHFPLIRRVPRHLPPKGKAFPAGWVTPPYGAIKKSSRGRGGACPARDRML